MSNAVAVFVPCRAGSTRVPRKNTRPFAGREDGLVGLKLEQLEKLRGVDAIILDSNDPAVLDIGRQHLGRWRGAATLLVRERPDALGQTTTTTDELIDYALQTVDAETLLWTHVTSPLCDAEVYEHALAAFRARDAALFDSLMSVTKLHAFLWSEQAPLNYARDPVRWPHTQSIEAVYEVNSAIFIVPMTVGRQRHDRIGARPLLWPISRQQALDVDWEDDFAVAESAYRVRCARQGGADGKT